MSNQAYPLGFKAFLDGGIDLLTGTIKLQPVSALYVFSDADEFYSDLSNTIGTPGTLASKTTTGGVFNSANVSITPPTGTDIQALVMYEDTGTAGTSRLIAYLDTANGLPLTPSGGTITVIWDNGAISGIAGAFQA